MKPETRRVIREHEAAGFTSCPEYRAAILGFYRKHVCRLARRQPPAPDSPPALGRERGPPVRKCLVS